MTKVIDRIDRLMESLPREDRRTVALHVSRTYGGPMSATERSQRFRSIHGNESVAAQRNENVASVGNEVVARRRNENVASERNENVAAPPAPPVVSKLLSFSVFWSNYPKRVGKGEARKAWTKQDCEKKAAFILESLEKQREFLLRDGGKFVPNPATWLNQNRWEDEPPQPSFLSEKTSGNAAAARAFVEGKTGHDEPR